MKKERIESIKAYLKENSPVEYDWLIGTLAVQGLREKTAHSYVYALKNAGFIKIIPPDITDLTGEKTHIEWIDGIEEVKII